MRILLFAGIAAIVVGALLIGVYLWSQNRVLDKDGMIYEPEPGDVSAPAVSRIYILTSGDENGCSYSWEAYLVSADKVQVIIRQQPTHNSREKVTKRTVDLDVLAQVSAIIDEYGMTDWDNLPPAELFALDAASTSMSFTYRGEDHRFSDSQEVPSGGWKAVSGIKTILEEAAGVK